MLAIVYIAMDRMVKSSVRSSAVGLCCPLPHAVWPVLPRLLLLLAALPLFHAKRTLRAATGCSRLQEVDAASGSRVVCVAVCVCAQERALPPAPRRTGSMYTVPTDSHSATRCRQPPRPRYGGQGSAFPGKASWAVMFAPEVMKAAWRGREGGGLSAMLCRAVQGSAEGLGARTRS